MVVMIVDFDDFSAAKKIFYVFIPPVEITKRLCGRSDLVLTSVLSQFTPVINTYITSTDRHDVFYTKKGKT